MKSTSIDEIADAVEIMLGNDLCETLLYSDTVATLLLTAMEAMMILERIRFITAVHSIQAILLT